MDKYIRRFPAVRDADLMIAAGLGVAWQADMTASVAYDEAYLAKVDAYDGTAVAEAVNAGRCALLARHLAHHAAVFDIGAGSGAFVRAARTAGFHAKGFDVIPAAVARLRAADLYAEDAAFCDAVTLWDAIEHMADPAKALHTVSAGAWLFVSLPVFDDLSRIRESKHYRPGEHLLYFTGLGFVRWMSLYGFRLVEESQHEIAAGRENIGAFAFRRDLTEIHADLLPCSCGGEMRIDSYNFPLRPVEWFLRCRDCGKFSQPAPTAAEAEKLWKDAA